MNKYAFKTFLLPHTLVPSFSVYPCVPPLPPQERDPPPPSLPPSPTLYLRLSRSLHQIQRTDARINELLVHVAFTLVA